MYNDWILAKMGNSNPTNTLHTPGIRHYKCEFCNQSSAIKLQYCSSCKVALYCNKEHQQADRSKHKLICKDLKEARRRFKKDKKRRAAAATVNAKNEHQSERGQIELYRPSRNDSESLPTDTDDSKTTIMSTCTSTCITCSSIVAAASSYTSFILFMVLFYIYRIFCCCFPRRIQRNTYVRMKRYQKTLMFGFLFFLFLGIVTWFVKPTLNQTFHNGIFVKLNNINIMKDLLTNKKVKIDTIDHLGFTALSFAASRGRNDVVKFLLDYNPDLERSNVVGLTALMQASMANKLTTVKILLKAGADISAQSDCDTCLKLNALMMSIRLHPNIEPEMKPSSKIMSYKDLKTFRYLLRESMRESNVNQLDIKSGNILHMAAGIGQIEIVKEILNTDIDTDQEMDNGFTALQLAIYLNHRHLYPLFKNHSEKKKLYSPRAPRYRSVRYPLSFYKKFLQACLEGQTSLVKTFLSIEGINVNYKQYDQQDPAKQEYSALSSASLHGHNEVVNLLLSVDKINVNQYLMPDKSTALFGAIVTNHSKIAKLLLQQKGININHRMFNDATALNAACEYGRTSIVKQLLQMKGIDVNLSMKDGQNPLWISSYYGREKIVKMLFQNNDLDIKMSKSQGYSALEIARYQKHMKTFDLIESEIHRREQNSHVFGVEL